MDLIIGAGISGLSYANFIENDFFIVEKESEPGGYCKTIKRNGFVWDYSGHFFHFRNLFDFYLHLFHLIQSIRKILNKVFAHK